MSNVRSTIKLTWHDAPAIFLSIAALGLLAMTANMAATWLDSPPPYRELVLISGTVFDSFLQRSGKGFAQIHVLIQTGDRLHDCTQDASKLTTALLELAKGSQVSALVVSGSIARPENRIWEFRRGKTTMLSYKRLVDLQDDINSRGLSLGRALGVFGIVALGVAFFLRRRFGTWRTSRPEAAVR